MTVNATLRPVQWWANVAGWLCLVAVIPSALWRIAMLVGVDTGFAEAEYFRSTWSSVGYVLALDGLQLVAGVLCLGLIRPWGERVPRWLPGIGGRRIRRLIPLIVGGIGNSILYLILVPIVVTLVGTWIGLLDAWTPDAAMTSTQRVVMLAAYFPFFCWPLLVTVALTGYWLRRREE